MTVLKDYSTQDRLLDRLNRAAKRGVSREEMLRQRVDYIVGAMGDEQTKITSEMVERELGRLAGTPA